MGGADLGGGLLTLQPDTKLAQWEKSSMALSASFSYQGIA